MTDTTKLELPKGKFKHEVHAVAADAAMKAIEAKSAKLYHVPIERIKPIPGFNPRVRSADYLGHVSTIQASIAANGYDTKKPLAGYVADEDGEKFIYLEDGHTRLEAVQNLNADPDNDDDDKIATLPVLVSPKEVSLTDITVGLHLSNSGRPLTPFELGVVVKRLLAEPEANKAEIARRLAVTPRYLDDVLLLANADAGVKQHVASGAVSSTLAISLLRADKDTAADKIAAAVAKAPAGKKVTKKNVGVKMKKVKVDVPFGAGEDIKTALKTAAAEIRKVIPTEEGGEGEDVVKLTTVAGIVSMVISVPAPVAAKAAAKPKKKAKATPAPAKGKKATSEPESKPDTASATDAKPKKKKKKGAKAKNNDLGFPGAAPVGDEELAKLPPAVKSDDGEEEVEI